MSFVAIVASVSLGASLVVPVGEDVEGDLIRRPALKSVAVGVDDLERAAVVSPVVVEGVEGLGFESAVVRATPPPEPEPEPVVVEEEEESSGEEVEGEYRDGESVSRSRESGSEGVVGASEGAVSAGVGVVEGLGEVVASEGVVEGEVSVVSGEGGELRAAVVEASYKYLGTPYGTGAGQLDCSAFTQAVFAEFGISLPRTSGMQAGVGRVVSAEEALPGDLLWWPGHVGIYLGDGQHIAARNPSTPLSISPIWRANPTFIRVIEG